VQLENRTYSKQYRQSTLTLAEVDCYYGAYAGVNSSNSKIIGQRVVRLVTLVIARQN